LVLERGPLSLVRITEELLERAVAAPVYKTEINGRGDLLRWPRDTLYPLKLALTSPTIGGRSVGIVCWRTTAPKFFFCIQQCKEKWSWRACCIFHADFLLGLFYNHEDGGDIFLQDDRIVHFLCHFTSHWLDVHLLQKQICHYTGRYGHFVVKLIMLATSHDRIGQKLFFLVFC
jgi:hypothetical protein